MEERALRHVERAERKTTNVPGISGSIQPRTISKVGIVGAGTMGGGIAMCFANAGFPVVLTEANKEALDIGLARLSRNYDISVSRGKLTEKDKKNRLGLIKPSLDFSGFKGCDLIIEAVFEDMALKKNVFKTLSQVGEKNTILATNTSTLDVDEIANVVRIPENVIGLHFFIPANVMPLLEVVRGNKTSNEVIVTALALAKKIRKTPVLSGVCFGFIGNRMLQGYGREAQRMLLEGATPCEIDSVLEDFGMAMGILAVYDLAGIDIGHKIREAMGENRPKDPTFFKAGEVMFKVGRFGQKTKKGFYKYKEGTRQRFDDPEALELIKKAAKEMGFKQRENSKEEILKRCFYPLINEGAKILEEGIALRASDIDVVWTSGYGFTKSRGGPMFYADTLGLKEIRDGILKYREQFGPEFWEPASLLEKLVEEGKTFADWDRENA